MEDNSDLIITRKMIIMITALNHLTLAVSDIKRSFEFYHNVLGLKPLCRWDKGAYFLVGDLWFCLNVDPEVRTNPSYTHYAFLVTSEKFQVLHQRIIVSGANIFKQNISEGKSLYFLDPDGHKLEIHVGSWQSRIAIKKQDIGIWKNVEWFV
jgi:catechol 2,3-dioxygenase-like lactoylglutathione lyase family enzyme